MHLKKTILCLLSFFALSLSAQDFKYLTSETKYQDAVNFKKRVIAVELALQREIAGDDSPFSMFLSGGYDFRWLTKDNLYFSVGPRAKLGWLTGDNGYFGGDIERVSYDAFAWGFSAVPAIGLEIEESNQIIIYLEGEFGLLNHHAHSSFAQQQVIGQSPRKHNQDSYANLFAGIRLGITGNVSKGSTLGVWVGLNTMKTSQFLDKMNLQSSVADRQLDGEIGFSFKF